MFDKAPNGYFARDLIVFNGLAQNGHVAKGFVFQPPDLTNAQLSELNDFQDQVCLLLAALNDNQRLQVQFFCDSDYRNELLRYRQETERLVTNPWTRRTRNERFQRYWQQMIDRQLRRQKLVLYISRRIEKAPKGLRSEKALTDYYNTLLDQLHAEFAQVHEVLCTIFSGQGARIIPMTDADHYRHFKTFLSPSIAERFDYDPLEAFDPVLTIQENCWHSEAAGQEDFGFFMDGHYHSMLVLTRVSGRVNPAS